MHSFRTCQSLLLSSSIVLCWQLVISYNPTSNIPLPTPLPDFHEIFQHVKVQKLDCAEGLTLDTLKMLQTKDSKDVENKAFRETNLDDLRKFLYRKGFHLNPGSLKFMTNKEKTLKLICGDSKQGNDNVNWIAEGTKDDSQFSADASNDHVLRIRAPRPQLYFQRITCIRKGKCQHVFYLITRPYPMLTPSPSLREGESGEMKYAKLPYIIENFIILKG
jgi:virulence-associated protein VapD